MYASLNCQFISNTWYQGWTQILPFYLMLLISTRMLIDNAVIMKFQSLATVYDIGLNML